MVTRTRIDQAEDSSDMNLPVDLVIYDHTQPKRFPASHNPYHANTEHASIIELKLEPRETGSQAGVW